MHQLICCQTSTCSGNHVLEPSGQLRPSHRSEWLAACHAPARMLSSEHLQQRQLKALCLDQQCVPVPEPSGQLQLRHRSEWLAACHAPAHMLLNRHLQQQQVGVCAQINSVYPAQQLRLSHSSEWLAACHASAHMLSVGHLQQHQVEVYALINSVYPCLSHQGSCSRVTDESGGQLVMHQLICCQTGTCSSTKSRLVLWLTACTRA